MRTRLLVILAAVVVLVGVVVVGRIGWDRAHRSDLERALGLVPAGSLRVAYTDWAAVRRTLHVSAGTNPSGASVQSLVDKAYDRDLSAASSIDESAVALQEKYGFSPATARWEAYAQAKKGAAMVLRLPDDASFDAIAKRLAGLGYERPSLDTGVWDGGVDLVAQIDPSISPELQYVVLLRDQHLVVSSDTESYAALAAKVARGKASALSSVASVRKMSAHVGEPAAAIVWARDFACTDLAMSQADEAGQKQADQLIAEAGEVSPLSGLIMALAPDRELTVAEQFDSGEQARKNLRPRAKLAVGEAVGRGESTFSDDFTLTSSRTVDSTVLLTMHSRSKSAYVLSALYDGPVLFATC